MQFLHLLISWAWENPDGPATTPGDGELFTSPCLVSDEKTTPPSLILLPPQF